MPLSSKDARLVQLDHQLCFKLYAASRLMTKAYKPMLDSLEITYPQYVVLMVLWEISAPVTIGDLGARVLLDTGTLTPLLKRMEANGLLQRQRGAQDERQVWISLTESGAALQQQAISWVKSAQEKWGDSNLDVSGLRNQLQQLINLLKE